jgi:hypothetical protein
MALEFLVKPKGKIELQAQDSNLPGALIPIEIRVKIGEEIKPRALRVELVGEETYYVRRHSKHSSRIVHEDYAFAKITHTVAEQPALLMGVEQKWNCSLQIPPDALPSCQGKWVDIRWTLKAALDVPKRFDLSQEKPLRVFCPSPQISNMPVLPAEKTFGQVTLSLKAPQAVSAGNALKGQLALQVKDKLGIRSIRIELVQAEDAQARKANQVISTAQVSGEATFNQNESPSFEFSLDIPAEAPPTAVCKNSNLRWKIRAVIDRKMKTDFNVEQELFVSNAPKLTAK